ncbi:hypothetical protein RND81_12G126000 [Saponaria officinalis]|uniref:B3 domain-containing protein n=1 Tax=Saponaria officinalis TaxID=3572 RepID=A0AAW1H9T3_SAPOF
MSEDMLELEEEIEIWEYYLTKEEFSDCMLNFEEHKSKYKALLMLEKPEKSTEKRVCYGYRDYWNDNGSSSGLTDEECRIISKGREAALRGINNYFANRSNNRKRKVRCFENEDEKIVDLSRIKEKRKVRCFENEDGKIVDLSRIKEKGKVRYFENEDGKIVDLSRIKKVKREIIPKNKLRIEFIDRIRELNGRNVQLVAQKALTASDLNVDLNRLLLNNKSIIRNYFLSKSEDAMIQREGEFLDVKLLEPTDRTRVITLKKWRMENNLYYSLLKPWKIVVADNGFGEHDVVQVWTFRFDGVDEPNQLGVAVVRIFKAPQDEIGSSSSVQLA